MKRISQLTLLFLALLPLTLATVAQTSTFKTARRATPPAAQSAEQIAGKVEAQVKTAIADGLNDFGKRANLALDTQKLGYGAVGDTLIAVAPVYGVERLTAKEFDGGKVVGVLSISAPLKIAGGSGKLPAGLYEMKIWGDPKSPTSKAQFIRDGKVVLETVTKIAADTSAPPPTPSGGSLQAAVARQPYTARAAQPVAYANAGSTATTVQAVCERRCYAIIELKRLRQPNGCCGDWQFTGLCFFN